MLASLSHPHIAAMYGLEGGALLTEQVEGPTLADQLRAGGAERNWSVNTN